MCSWGVQNTCIHVVADNKQVKRIAVASCIRITLVDASRLGKVEFLCLVESIHKLRGPRKRFAAGSSAGSVFVAVEAYSCLCLRMFN